MATRTFLSPNPPSQLSASDGRFDLRVFLRLRRWCDDTFFIFLQVAVCFPLLSLLRNGLDVQPLHTASHRYRHAHNSGGEDEYIGDGNDVRLSKALKSKGGCCQACETKSTRVDDGLRRYGLCVFRNLSEEAINQEALSDGDCDRAMAEVSGCRHWRATNESYPPSCEKKVATPVFISAWVNAYNGPLFSWDTNHWL